MRKLRKFVVELVLVALVVGWALLKFPDKFNQWVPWIVVTIALHLLYECVWQTDLVKSWRTKNFPSQIVGWTFLVLCSSVVCAPLWIVTRNQVRRLVASSTSDKITPMKQETPTRDVAKQPNLESTAKKPANSKPKARTTIENTGHNNVANPGTVVGQTELGQCAVFQNGGSNNTVTTNCVPPERHLTTSQVESLHVDLDKIWRLKLSIWAENFTPEMRAYEQDWFQMCLGITSGWTCQEPSGGWGAPTPKGIVVQVKTQGDPIGEKLRSALKNAGIESSIETSDFLGEYDARLIIGSP